MRIFELFENHDKIHQDALDRTGFWGSQGAGCVIIAADTKRILLPLRSGSVEQPYTWGTWGGAIDPDEDPAQAVQREVHEEAGYHGSMQVFPLYVFAKNSFRYFNFAVLVGNEFTPTLNWETDRAEWVKFGEWPKPLHFGLAGLLSDHASFGKIQQLCLVPTV